MEKAYDRVDWFFLKQVLLPDSTSIPRGSRWLRNAGITHGSRCLLMVRGFKKLVDAGLCSPFKGHRGDVSVTHLLFADDTLIFLDGGIRSIRAVKNFLQRFQQVSGQKVEGGLGIKRLKDVMDAFRLKMAWSVLFRAEKSLWGKFVQARYNQDISNQGQSALSSAASLLWKQEDINLIFHGGFCLTGGPDTPFWPLTPLGLFTVISACELCHERRPSTSWGEKIWNKKVPPKISMLVWRVIKKALPTDDAIMTRGLQMASRCSCCHEELHYTPSMETAAHIFLQSNQASDV
ncbi:uncharacterized protein LOC131225782 [Magnolia sinica]|uniref:uncharacterized protein LOC131225782 n=1 Tax=Magnolia sinica TaxID=86752 RepID=UPI00265A03BC|nr:uncharacterized protein LOC131225782 [Magnolia sinica]